MHSEREQFLARLARAGACVAEPARILDVDLNWAAVAVVVEILPTLSDLENIDVAGRLLCCDAAKGNAAATRALIDRLRSLNAEAETPRGNYAKLGLATGLTKTATPAERQDLIELLSDPRSGLAREPIAEILSRKAFWEPSLESLFIEHVHGDPVVCCIRGLAKNGGAAALAALRAAGKYGLRGAYGHEVQKAIRRLSERLAR